VCCQCVFVVVSFVRSILFLLVSCTSFSFTALANRIHITHQARVMISHRIATQGRGVLTIRIDVKKWEPLPVDARRHLPSSEESCQSNS
jgi:hypothetical protein